MNYDEFVDRVAQRAGVDREQAEKLTRATLDVLQERISGGQANDLGAALEDLRLARLFRVAPGEPAEKFGFEGFVDRVRRRAPDVPEEKLAPGIRAVMLTLRDAVPEKEFRDTMDQLPKEFREVLEGRDPLEAARQDTASAGAGGQAVRATGQDDAVVQRTAERAGMSMQDAARLTQATLETLGDRIGGQQAHDLAQRLPETSAQWLDELPDTEAHEYGPDDFVSRVRDRATGVQDDDITPGIQAVMIALRDAVGEAEIEIALSPLPGEYDELIVRVG